MLLVPLDWSSAVRVSFVNLLGSLACVDSILKLSSNRDDGEMWRPTYAFDVHLWLQLLSDPVGCTIQELAQFFYND